MNAVNILKYILPVIHFLKCVLKTKCTIFNLICPHGSECFGISLVTPLASTFCCGLILELISSQFSAAVGGDGGGAGEIGLISDARGRATSPLEVSCLFL